VPPLAGASRLIRTLITLEQFIRPLPVVGSTPRPADYTTGFLFYRGDFVAQPFVERIDRIHLAIFLKDRRPVAIMLESSGAAPYQQTTWHFL
jgi:hypothetical protein